LRAQTFARQRWKALGFMLAEAVDPPMLEARSFSGGGRRSGGGGGGGFGYVGGKTYALTPHAVIICTHWKCLQ